MAGIASGYLVGKVTFRRKVVFASLTRPLRLIMHDIGVVARSANVYKTSNHQFCVNGLATSTVDITPNSGK